MTKRNIFSYALSIFAFFVVSNCAVDRNFESADDASTIIRGAGTFDDRVRFEGDGRVECEIVDFMDAERFGDWPDDASSPDPRYLTACQIGTDVGLEVYESETEEWLANPGSNFVVLFPNGLFFGHTGDYDGFLHCRREAAAAVSRRGEDDNSPHSNVASRTMTECLYRNLTGKEITIPSSRSH